MTMCALAIFSIEIWKKNTSCCVVANQKSSNWNYRSFPYYQYDSSLLSSHEGTRGNDDNVLQLLPCTQLDAKPMATSYIINSFLAWVSPPRILGPSAECRAPVLWLELCWCARLLLQIALGMVSALYFFTWYLKSTYKTYWSRDGCYCYVTSKPTRYVFLQHLPVSTACSRPAGWSVQPLGSTPGVGPLGLGTKALLSFIFTAA